MNSCGKRLFPKLNKRLRDFVSLIRLKVNAHCESKEEFLAKIFSAITPLLIRVNGFILKLT